MLVGALVGEFAEAVFRIGEDLAQLSQHLFAALGETAIAFGYGQLVNRELILLRVDEPTAAVTAIVIDVKRHITCRCRSECRRRRIEVGIGIIVACALQDILLKILLRRLGKSRGDA